MTKKLTPAEVASLGGKAVPREKRTFSLDKGKASEAGRKGGFASAHKRWGWPDPGEKRKKKSRRPARADGPPKS